MDDHECKNISANSSLQREIDNCENTNTTDDDDARQSPGSPNSAVLGTSGMDIKHISLFPY